MRRKRMRLVSLILSAVCLLGCAVQPAPVSDSSESNTKVSAYAASQAEQNEEERTVAESLLPQTEDGGDTSESSVAPERAGAENADNAAEKQPTTAETAPPTTPEQPATPAPVPEDKPAPAPTPVPTPAEEKQEEQPAPAPKPAASGNIYSIAEAVRAGNEYARAQYGVTIDTSMTTADSSYFPGTADSVAWLAEWQRYSLPLVIGHSPHPPPPCGATWTPPSPALPPWTAQKRSARMRGSTVLSATMRHRTNTSWWCCTDNPTEYPAERPTA